MISETLSYYDFDEKHHSTYDVDLEEPRICYHCNHTGEQIFVSGMVFSEANENEDAVCFFNCYYCQKTSIHFMSFKNRNNYSWLETDSVLPKAKLIENQITQSNAVLEKFPEFFNIYNQSQKAQDEKLDQIAGMGFRKALEFLVTDFLLSYPPDGVVEEWLKNPKTSLSNKIEKLENQRIKKLSKAISFLGNDETHYTRRHPEHDVESIKMFIKALLSDVENEMTLLEAEKLLNKGKK
ncbi:hypothetical protein A5886_001829 [Enterococcus sp. 8G7_MSG3316]|uniref:Uncharacterized protein n=1 Tax=Candidatus Enterococcus testudinis TaxID=1834191 RepID=A0A242A788_9ENTE|nr:DUF4145 domain-containing protein [Enterococcus sp. 8G7_MSG3316]OTN76750.1 hypothetical protein A5886_001829 [Enterococcus sp. 8G7_MSG3316]